MRDLHKFEVAAMWLFGNDYAPSGLGAIEYWRQLSPYKKSLVRSMVEKIEEARAETEDDLFGG